MIGWGWKNTRYYKFIFPVPVIESAISPRNPGFFQWRIVFFNTGLGAEYVCCLGWSGLPFPSPVWSWASPFTSLASVCSPLKWGQCCSPPPAWATIKWNNECDRHTQDPPLMQLLTPKKGSDKVPKAPRSLGGGTFLPPHPPTSLLLLFVSASADFFRCSEVTQFLSASEPLHDFFISSRSLLSRSPTSRTFPDCHHGHPPG